MLVWASVPICLFVVAQDISFHITSTITHDHDNNSKKERNWFLVLLSPHLEKTRSIDFTIGYLGLLEALYLQAVGFFFDSLSLQTKLRSTWCFFAARHGVDTHSQQLVITTTVLVPDQDISDLFSAHLPWY